MRKFNEGDVVQAVGEVVSTVPRVEPRPGARYYVVQVHERDGKNVYGLHVLGGNGVVVAMADEDALELVEKFYFRVKGHVGTFFRQFRSVNETAAISTLTDAICKNRSAYLFVFATESWEMWRSCIEQELLNAYCNRFGQGPVRIKC